MMQVSANEVYQTARKACLAAGYLPDRAEDVSLASCWLQYAGFNGCGELDLLLAQEIEKNLTAPVQLQLQVKNSCLHVAKLRPAYEGIAAIDWLLASGDAAQIHIDKIEHPLVVAALLWRAGLLYQKQFQIQADGLAMPVLLPEAGLDRLKEIGTLSGKVVIQVNAEISLPITVPAGPSEVDEKTWERLNNLAAQTYVPETESSRLSGAGAGLVDND